MKWEGSRLRQLATERGFSLQKVADGTSVSRQTVNEWIGGQVPKGNHLVALCKLFGVNPTAFFSGEPESTISVPTHRRRMHSKITDLTQKDAFELSKEYLNIFRNSEKSQLVLVIRSKDGKDREDAMEIARQMRSHAGIPEDKPFDYQHTFKLAEALGIHVIFRDFPKSIKSYAFYVKIDRHRVVFVDNSTNVIDLIFPVLHEFVHAIRDELNQQGEYSETEEAFCDSVAGLVQFPPAYVDLVHGTIRLLDEAQQVNALKGFASKYGHSLFGIVKAIKLYKPSFELQVGGADSNLRKQFPTIGEIISRQDDVRHFLDIMHLLSGKFLNVIASQVDSISNRKLAELLGMKSELDAVEIKAELLRGMSSPGS